MKSISPLVFIALFISGCAYFQGDYDRLKETEGQLVERCHLLGVISETADADRILSHPAKYEMIGKVKKRALELGATHIVWLHKTSDSAAAQAYQCPE